MPYITSKEKEDLIIYGSLANSSGQLNYQLTHTIREYIQTHGLCYRTINDVIGALEGCKLEFYRRVASKYEDSKKEINGDVYD